MKGTWKRGEITVFVSLLLAVLLFFFQACLTSARYAVLRTQTEEAVELAEYSVLSEYNRELLKRYGLFYLDLSYGTGVEDTDYLNQRIQYFLEENMTFGKVVGLTSWEYSRATDENGTAYYEQAVSLMKQKTGAALLEKLTGYESYVQIAEEAETDYAKADAKESANLEELKERRLREEEKETPDPVTEMKERKQSAILNMVLKNPEAVSGKKADLSAVPSGRTLLTGSGARGIVSPGVANDIFFLAYLMEYFSCAEEYLAEGKESTEWLDYQLEYLIAGKDSDLANLEAVCGRLLAMREGMNYAYLLTDAGRVSECEAYAAALVGITLIPALVEAVKQVLLLAWAFAESVVDVRLLLNGNRVAFYKNAVTWKTSLSAALSLGDLSEFDDREDAEGLVYKEYLGILLAAVERTKKVMRSLDIMEGVIRQVEGRWFYIDQCTDGFRIRTVIENGRELTVERRFCYEW